jgi:hypothetical protein
VLPSAIGSRPDGSAHFTVSLMAFVVAMLTPAAAEDPKQALKTSKKMN